MSALLQIPEAARDSHVFAGKLFNALNANGEIENLTHDIQSVIHLNVRRPWNTVHEALPVHYAITTEIASQFKLGRRHGLNSDRVMRRKSRSAISAIQRTQQSPLNITDPQTHSLETCSVPETAIP